MSPPVAWARQRGDSTLFSREDSLHDIAVNVREPKITTIVAVGQFFVMETEKLLAEIKPQV